MSQNKAINMGTDNHLHHMHNSMTNNMTNISGFDHDQSNSRRDILNYKDQSNPGIEMSSYLNNNVAQSDLPKYITPNNDHNDEAIDSNLVNQFPVLKNRLLNNLEENIKSRKYYNVSGWQVVKIMYCSCCMSKQDKIINSTIEYIEKTSEFGNFLKTSREIENFKKLSLDEEQRKLKILSSINLNNEADENEEKGKGKKKEPKVEDNYVEELNQALGVLKTIDLSHVENRILAENLISSIV